VRCQLDPQQALELAKKATSIHPDDGDLRSELNDLLDVSAQVVLSHAAQMSH
jgi:hypothetical protein